MNFLKFFFFNFLPQLEMHIHEFDVQILDYFQFRNECKFPQIDICMLLNNNNNDGNSHFNGQQ